MYDGLFDKYILESEYGNKAYVLQENINKIKNCKIRGIWRENRKREKRLLAGQHKCEK